MRARLAGTVAVVACLAGCGGASGPPEAVECTVQARPTAGSAAGETTTSVRVEREDGGAPAGAQVVAEPFGVDVTFAGEAPEGRYVAVEVTGADGDRLVRDLFQYGGTDGADGADGPDALRTEFAGGHGFTGLRYVHDGGAELQYFCRATG